MITIITTSLFIESQIDNPALSIFMILGFIGLVAQCFFSDDTKPKKKSSYRPPRTNRTYKFEDDYPDYTDYDPSWDDAWFEKTDQDPWFDDNHGKK